MWRSLVILTVVSMMLVGSEAWLKCIKEIKGEIGEVMCIDKVPSSLRDR
jgi:hypothetical protein